MERTRRKFKPATGEGKACVCFILCGQDLSRSTRKGVFAMADLKHPSFWYGAWSAFEEAA